MIDPGCPDCLQTTGGCWRHSGVTVVSTPMTTTYPPAAPATTDDLMAELLQLRGSLDATLRDLKERVRWLERHVFGDPKDE
jgi:hypothetical protein